MPTPSITHIVVLMLENRAFDHMVGYLHSDTYRIDGVDRANPPSNPIGPHDPTPVLSSNDAPDRLPFDAGHKVYDVNLQLFFNIAGPPPTGPTNKGFVYSYSLQSGATATSGPLIMKCFDPATSNSTKALSLLAQEFAICTHWYSSVPGPTWPNRFFAHCATSKGVIDNDAGQNYDMRTIFENLSDAGKSWKIYSHDTPQAQLLNNISENPDFDDNWDSFGGFLEDAAGNTLPNYAFIEPKYSTLLGDANDQHPPHSIAAGDQLIARVYDALRNSAAWSETLLVIVYDEHGGTFDHQLPPHTVAPDAHTSLFPFDRLGVRVPAVLISPFIAARTIVATEFEHCSIPATLKKMFGVPHFLTKRDAVATTFDGVFNRSAPRTDAPVDVSRPMAVPHDEWGDEVVSVDEIRSQLAMGAVATAPVSDHLMSLVEAARRMAPIDRVSFLGYARPITTEHDAAVYLRQAAARIRQVRRERSRRRDLPE